LQTDFLVALTSYYLMNYTTFFTAGLAITPCIPFIWSFNDWKNGRKDKPFPINKDNKLTVYPALKYEYIVVVSQPIFNYPNEVKADYFVDW